LYLGQIQHTYGALGLDLGLSGLLAGCYGRRGPPAGIFFAALPGGMGVAVFGLIKRRNLFLVSFFCHIIFLPDVDVFDLAIDEFRSSPLEISNWCMLPLDFKVRKALVTRARIIGQKGFKWAWREASLYFWCQGECTFGGAPRVPSLQSQGENPISSFYWLYPTMTLFKKLLWVNSDFLQGET
jgi:hypothetical protein